MEREVKSRRPSESPSERGFSLVELTMAFAIFLVAALAAYALYYAGTRSFKKAENVTALQQNARVGFDRMVRELRLAGFNHNSDGTPSRPDEQIEGAWDTAVTLRGDFDFEDATLSASPESTLDGTFNEVTVGNDEIVTYALGKPTLPNGTAISFISDVIEVPRDGDEETVGIPGPILVQNDPPYTLYRIAPKNVADITGFDNAFDEAVEFEYQAIAEDIKSLSFRYYDTAGNLVNPATPADATDDIGGADAGRTTRANISRVEVALEAMTPDPDMEWTDPSDTDPATQAHRKVTLTAMVNPRNLGRKGIQDIDLVPPSTPTGLTACVGHCGGTVLSWTANPPAQGVSQYTVAFGTSSGNLTSTRTTGTNSVFVGTLDPTGTYYFSVRAEDAGGNTSSFSSEVPATNTNNTEPDAVPGFSATASTSTPGIELGWTTLGQNDGTVTGASGSAGCDIAKPANRDLGGYGLFRGEGSDPTTAAGDEYVPASTLTAATTTHLDTQVVACRSYTYDIRALDACAVAGADQASTVSASYTTTDAPAAPTNVNAASSNGNQNAVVWDPVTADVNGNPIEVASYYVYRAAGYPGIPPSDSAFTGSSPVGSSTTTSYQDNFTSNPPSTGQVYYYKISALDDCPNESALSDADAADCAFDGQVLIDPQDGDTVLGIVPITLSSDGMDTYAYGEFAIVDPSANMVFSSTSSTYPFMFSWNSLSLSPGIYKAAGRITNIAGCTQASTVSWQMISPAACCLSQTGFGVVSDNRPDSDIVIRLLANLCDNNLTVSSITVTYTTADTRTLLDEVRWNGASITSGNNHASPYTTPVSVSVPSVFNGGGEQTLVFDFDRPLAAGDSLALDVTYSGTVVGTQTCSFSVVVGTVSP